MHVQSTPDMRGVGIQRQKLHVGSRCQGSEASGCVGVGHGSKGEPDLQPLPLAAGTSASRCVHDSCDSYLHIEAASSVPRIMLIHFQLLAGEQPG